MAKTGLKYILSLFSANALQILFSQLGSLFLFWLSSKELSKPDFGSFNWYFAIYGSIIAIFSFGFDFIIIKRVSSKNDLGSARVQLIQSIIICSISIIPLILFMFYIDSSSQFKETFFILVAFQFTYLSLPFKNVLTGKELFFKSAQSVIFSNLVKILLIISLYATHAITLYNVSLTLALCNFIELLVYIINSYSAFEHNFFKGAFNFSLYKSLLKESLPQLGVIVFDSAFARIDWILIGVLSTSNANLNTAEYSFAYKIFELSKLPLLILAPILFTRFSKLFYNSQGITKDTRSGIVSFFKIELIIGMVIPITLNIVWVPLMQFFTANKYGPDNSKVYFLLSCTVPIIYMINFLWTIAFARGQLRLTMVLSIINSILNILLNVVLIPNYGQLGAAWSFLICNVVMFPVYYYFVKQDSVKLPLKSALIILVIGIACGTFSFQIELNAALQCLICIISYGALLFGFKVVRISDLRMLNYFINKN